MSIPDDADNNIRENLNQAERHDADESSSSEHSSSKQPRPDEDN